MYKLNLANYNHLNVVCALLQFAPVATRLHFSCTYFPSYRSSRKEKCTLGKLTECFMSRASAIFFVAREIYFRVGNWQVKCSMEKVLVKCTPGFYILIRVLKGGYGVR